MQLEVGFDGRPATPTMDEFYLDGGTGRWYKRCQVGPSKSLFLLVFVRKVGNPFLGTISLLSG